jgi:hypothetical protein
MRISRKHITLILLLTSAGTAIASPMSDSDISRLLVGTWIADPNQPDPGSPEAQEMERHATEIFNADHTGVVNVYSDVTCTNIAGKGYFTWAVRDGQIYARVSGGMYTYATVVSIDAKTKVTHIDKASNGPIGVITHSIRAKDCATPLP